MQQASMQTKVCGLTQPGQLELIGARAHFAGMIFHPPSRRYIGDFPPADYAPDKIKALKTGVFVDASESKIRSMAERFQLEAIQLHGNESPALCKKLQQDFTLLKAIRIGTAYNFSDLDEYHGLTDYFLFDTAGKLPGGNGLKFAWNILQQYKGATPFFLSGGIAPEDAGSIQNFRHPKFTGVDINSRFETAPGKKDIQKVQQFLHALAT